MRPEGMARTRSVCSGLQPQVVLLSGVVGYRRDGVLRGRTAPIPRPLVPEGRIWIDGRGLRRSGFWSRRTDPGHS